MPRRSARNRTGNRAQDVPPVANPGEGQPPAANPALSLTSASNIQKLMSFNQAEKLGNDAQGYIGWRKLLESILRYNNSLDIVEGRSEILENNPECAEWFTLHNHAHTQIIFSLEHGFLESLEDGPEDSNCAHHLWSQIETLFKRDSEADKMVAWKKLLHYRMKDDIKFSDHMMHMQTLRKMASNTGYIVSDVEWVMIILCSLLDSWASFIEEKSGWKSSHNIIVVAERREEVI